MRQYIDLESLTLDELAGVVNLYPWFANARREFCLRLAATGNEESALSVLADSALYVPAGKILSAVRKGKTVADCSDKDLDTILKSYIAGGDAGRNNTGGQHSRKVLVVGGDYFSQEEYDRIKKSGDAVQVPQFTARQEGPGPEPDSREEEAPLEFYTETLARIYAEQGYPEQARKIYSKLILAYPEKNAYFAALIRELEIKNQG